MVATEGMLVWWIHCPRGGYSMPVRVPAVVIRLNKKTVAIWAATMRQEAWAKRLNVKIDHLKLRTPEEPWKGISSV